MDDHSEDQQQPAEISMQATENAPADSTQDTHTLPDDSRVNTEDAQVVAEQPVDSYEDDADEATRLTALGAGTRDQDDLERDIGRQADAMLTEQADERDNKRLEKASTDKTRLEGQIKRLERKLTEFGNKTTKDRYRAEIANYLAQVESLDTDLEQIQRRIDERHGEESRDGETLLSGEGNQRQPGESRREFLIRTGKITPFSKMGGQTPRPSNNLADIMLDAEREEEEVEDAAEHNAQVTAELSHRNLLKPGFADEDDQRAINEVLAEFADERPAKRRKLRTRQEAHKPMTSRTDVDDVSETASDDAYKPEVDVDEEDLEAVGRSGDSEEPADEDIEGDFSLNTPGTKKRGRKGKQRVKAGSLVSTEQEDLAGIDDGNEGVYQARLQSWVERRSAARRRAQQSRGADEAGDDPVNGIEEDGEWHLPHPTRPDTEIESGFRIPGDIYPSLFDYQKTSVQLSLIHI